MQSIRLPLHINPNDMSQDAKDARADLAYTMAQINPRGFRPFGGLVEKRSAEAGHTNLPPKKDRTKIKAARKQRLRT